MSTVVDESQGNSSGALKRLFAGFALLAPATLGLLARADEGSPAWAGWDSALGILASLLIFGSLYQLSLARRSDYPLRLAAALWSGELGMRIAVTLLPDGQLPIGEARILRLFLAGGAGLCLAWSFGRSVAPARLQALWIAVRWCFTLQLAVYFTLELLALTSSRSAAEIVERVPEAVAVPLAWTTFALPFTSLLFALHRTLRSTEPRSI